MIIVFVIIVSVVLIFVRFKVFVFNFVIELNFDDDLVSMVWINWFKNVKVIIDKFMFLINLVRFELIFYLKILKSILFILIFWIERSIVN